MTVILNFIQNILIPKHNIILIHHLMVKWHSHFQPTLAGVSIVAESPVSANISWSMSYQRFLASARVSIT